jgi:methionine-rich copper-binding protein CopC
MVAYNRALSPARSTATLAVCLVSVLWAIEAQAHASLITADPAPNATVTAPKQIHLQFSTELAKKFSTFKLTDTDGKPIRLMIVDSHDPKVLEAMATASLQPGLYTVSWTAVSTDDGHKTMGSFSFTVQ